MKDFKNFDVEKVKNGFILTFNRLQCCTSNEVYVFNTIEQLSDFIRDIEKDV